MQLTVTYECDHCGKNLFKRACVMLIADDPVCANILGDPFVFCSKPCAIKWRGRNTSFVYEDPKDLEEGR